LNGCSSLRGISVTTWCAERMETALRQYLPNGQFQGVTPERSRSMAAVRARQNRTTERRLRFALVRAGIRGWRLHRRDVEGTPDFLFADHRLAVFVDGCFWHGCPRCGHVPKTNHPFWAAKIARNRERDSATAQRLHSDGYRVLRFWEHELKEELAACVEQIRTAIECVT